MDGVIFEARIGPSEPFAYTSFNDQYMESIPNAYNVYGNETSVQFQKLIFVQAETIEKLIEY